MHIGTISSKGQLVIPKKMRRILHLSSGQKVVIILDKDHLEIIPLPENPAEAFCGYFKKGSSLVNALLKERMEDNKREEKDSVRFLRTSRLPGKRKKLSKS